LQDVTAQNRCVKSLSNEKRHLVLGSAFLVVVGWISVALPQCYRMKAAFHMTSKGEFSSGTRVNRKATQKEKESSDECLVGLGFSRLRQILKQFEGIKLRDSVV
jgi:hypothetical protein